MEYWESAVVCYVLGANPPISVMEGYLKRIWGKLGIEKISLLNRGIFMVRMSSPFGTAFVEFLVERDQIVLKHREFDKQFLGKKSYQKKERFLFSFKHSMSVNSIPPCFP